MEEKNGVYIYGAGKVAKSLLEWLKQQSMIHKVKGIMVSKSDSNPDSVCGVPVYIWNELDSEEPFVVLVAMYERMQVTVLNALWSRRVREIYMMKNELCTELIDK